MSNDHVDCREKKNPSDAICAMYGWIRRWIPSGPVLWGFNPQACYAKIKRVRLGCICTPCPKPRWNPSRPWLNEIVSLRRRIPPTRNVSLRRRIPPTVLWDGESLEYAMCNCDDEFKARNQPSPDHGWEVNHPKMKVINLTRKGNPRVWR